MAKFAHEIYRNPIYIYAPPYKEYSAGVRTLYYLCHILNQLGHLSWIVESEKLKDDVSYTSGFLNAPLLTSAIAKSHFELGLPPIVIYPETVIGNPLNAQLVARWLLSYPGSIGGPTSFEETDFCFAYSASIARAHGGDLPVVFIPPVSTSELEQIREIYPLKERPIDGLVYAGKYRGFVGNPRLPEWAPRGDYLEIWREGPRKQSRGEVLQLIANSKVLFAFENTTLITEAILLGTPVVLVKSEFFSELIALDELTDCGSAWSTSPNAISLATESLGDAWGPYLESLNNVENSVRTLANSLYKFAGATDYLEVVKIQIKPIKQSFQKVRLALRILKSDGVLALFIEILNTLRRVLRSKND